MISKLNLLIVLVACSAGIGPAESMSRWFSATYQDLRYTLQRYGHCIDELTPLKDYALNETDYLIHQIRVFLDQGNYENEQLANVTALMNSICRSDIDINYPISAYINLTKYSGPEGKGARCHAIDEALDPMFYVLKRAALNRSEPLDFSIIQWYPNATEKQNSYNLVDLINTSWIKSDTMLEHVCRITDAVKDYIQSRTKATKRADMESVRRSLIDFLDRLLDPILGLQKRLYWEGTNRIEQFQTRVSYGLGSLRSGIGRGVKSTRDRVTSLFVSSTNSTGLATNVTTSSTSLNSTSQPQTAAQPVSISPTAPFKPVNQTAPVNGTKIDNFV